MLMLFSFPIVSLQCFAYNVLLKSSASYCFVSYQMQSPC